VENNIESIYATQGIRETMNANMRKLLESRGMLHENT
jgi:hypothetical protein